MKYGKWKLIKRDKPKSLCQCECGTKKEVFTKDLLNGKSTNCGCVRRKNSSIRAINRNYRHGLRKTNEYTSWKAMKSRCDNKDDPYYKDYGGRGIAICKEWYNFEVFYKDMGKRPKGYTLERIDCNKNYCKPNCRWATRKEQSRNKRNTILIKLNGTSMPLSKACEITKTKYVTAYWRFKQGWMVKDIFK